MKYNYRSGVEQNKKISKFWISFPVIGVIAGSYLLVNAFSPAIVTPFDQPGDVTAKKMTQEKPSLNENRLYIPQINIDIAVVTGDTEMVLEKGAWQRRPDNGDPKNGGNYAVSAKRFQLGFTPAETRKKSPFYYIDQLNEGDQIYVDFEGTRYAYSVTRTYKTTAAAIEIEQRSEQNKLTLYSSVPQTEKISREVVEAKPIGIIAWDDESPKLKSL